MIPKTRKDKLVLLQKYLNLESGEVDKEAFSWENDLYEKAIRKKSLDRRIRGCSLCEGLNIKRLTEGCPGWGDLNAKVFFIGQSLHKPGIVSDLPFILGSGYILDAALRLSGLLRRDVFITNAIHCHPAGNRGSLEDEKKNCLRFLHEELDIVWPELVVALGNDAKWAVERLSRELSDFKVIKVKHPASFMYGAPEQRKDWILKLSLEIDKIYNEKD